MHCETLSDLSFRIGDGRGPILGRADDFKNALLSEKNLETGFHGLYNENAIEIGRLR